MDVNTVDGRVTHLRTIMEHRWKYAGFDSILNYELALPPEIIFYNTAMEPGHLKWGDHHFRYGTIGERRRYLHRVPVPSQSGKFRTKSSG